MRDQSPDTRVFACAKTSAATIVDFFHLWRHSLRRISGETKLLCRVAPPYFRTFLTDRPIEFDSNIVEHAIRSQDNYEKKTGNSLGSDSGGQLRRSSRRCNSAPDGQNKQPRSVSLAHSNASAYRQPPAGTAPS